jgi:hypothetical protein
MAFPAEDRAAHLWLERHLIVLAAVVTHDLESLRCVVAFSGLLRSALGASLRRHHVPLVKDLLFFLCEKKGLFTLNARGFDVRHCYSPLQK